MTRQSEAPEGQVRYFMTEENFLARVFFDAYSGEVVSGQVLDDEAEWCEFPADQILEGGAEISAKQARRRVKRLGGAL